jgi:hypothetical protein
MMGHTPEALQSSRPRRSSRPASPQPYRPPLLLQPSLRLLSRPKSCQPSLRPKSSQPGRRQLNHQPKSNLPIHRPPSLLPLNPQQRSLQQLNLLPLNPRRLIHQQRILRRPIPRHQMRRHSASLLCRPKVICVYSPLRPTLSAWHAARRPPFAGKSPAPAVCED